MGGKGGGLWLADVAPCRCDVGVQLAWRLSTRELRMLTGSAVLLMGTLRAGLTRHRTLLFKVPETATWRGADAA